MTRVTKKPEERKQELIETAMNLFLKKGYEQTAVSDIVKEVNVAQGTFYYYFKSKIDILEAAGEKFIEDVIDKVRQIASNKKVDVAKRIDDMIDYFTQFYKSNKKLVDYLHTDSNIILHQKLSKKTLDKLLPIFKNVIEEGVSKGRFHVKYPVETAEFLIHAVGISHQPEVAANIKKRKRVKYTVEENIKRILGVKDYDFDYEM